MKKLFLYLFSLLSALLLLLSLSGCGKKESKTHYTLQICYDAEAHTLTGEQEITYTNTAEESLTELRLHLYPNAFRENAAIRPYHYGALARIFPDGISYGGIEVTSVSVENEAVAATVTGEDMGILCVPLPEPLAPEKTARLHLQFTTTLPHARHRMGYTDRSVSLGNFYPILCIYENGAFVETPYYANGETFYSASADYDVTLSVPSAYKVAHAGVLTEKQEKGEQTVYRIEGESLRDFAAVFSREYGLLTASAGKVDVAYYHYGDSNPQQTLQAAVDAVLVYSALFGSYPYPSLTLATADFYQGGMEYSSLVYLSALNASEDLAAVALHEVAHQWWAIGVGSNPHRYHYLDEGLAEYSVALFYGEKPSYGVNEQEYAQKKRESYHSFLSVYEQVIGSPNTSMTRSVDEFRSETEYVSIAYDKGFLLMHSLRESMGKQRFLSGLKRYYKRNLFREARPEALFDSLNRASGYRASDIAASYLNGTAVI